MICDGKYITSFLNFLLMYIFCSCIFHKINFPQEDWKISSINCLCLEKGCKNVRASVFWASLVHWLPQRTLVPSFFPLSFFCHFSDYSNFMWFVQVLWVCTNLCGFSLFCTGVHGCVWVCAGVCGSMRHMQV